MKENRKALSASLITLAAWPVLGFVLIHLYSALKLDRWEESETILALSHPILLIAGTIVLIRMYQLPFHFWKADSDRGHPFISFLKMLLIIFFASFGCSFFVGSLDLGLDRLFALSDTGTSPLELAQTISNAGRSGELKFILNGVLAPLSEELLLRAFLAQQLRKVLSLNAAILISSLVFAALHIEDWDPATLLLFFQLNFLPLALLGVFCAVVFFRFGWIAAALMHALYNLKSHVVQAFGEPPILFVGVAFVGIGYMVSIMVRHLRAPSSPEYR